MKIEITKDGTKKEIDLPNPKGRHVKIGLNKLLAVQDDDGSENLTAVKDYMDYVEKMTVECAPLSEEELDDLDCDDKNKILAFYEGKIQSRLDFLKSSAR